MGIAPVFLPVREMGGLLRRRQASPVELAELFIDRLETLGPRYNSVVTVTRERALAEARAAEKEIASGYYRGPLHGVPYGVKDLLATAGGIPTTWGAAPLRDQTFDYDATVVRRLTDAGAVLVAKLAMIELAGGMGYRQPDASFTGPCKTPWDLEHWAGGSSSGSGSAVAAGLVPFSIGSETRGSILSPANNCGIAGLRPTYGRVSRYGAMALSWTLDKLGPMCLTADDCGLVLDAIAGADPNDPSATDRSYSYQPSADAPKRFRLGVLEDATAGANPSVRANFDASLETLAQIADIERVRLPDLPYGAVAETIIFAEASSSLEEIVDSGQVWELTAPEDRYGHLTRRVVSARGLPEGAAPARGHVPRSRRSSLACGRRRRTDDRLGRRPAWDRVPGRGPAELHRSARRRRQRRRTTGHIGAQRLLRSGSADRDTVHGPRIRRQHRHRRGLCLPVPHRLAYDAPAGPDETTPGVN